MQQLFIRYMSESLKYLIIGGSIFDFVLLFITDSCAAVILFKAFFIFVL